MKRDFKKLLRISRRYGTKYTIIRVFGVVFYKIFAHSPFCKTIINHLSKTEFRFDGKPLKYTIHNHNTTWLNERALEITIGLLKLSQYNPKDVLELGNVLALYGRIKHVVVDKYEKASGAINEDIMNYRNPRKFKLIISISTLEHVGRDEVPRESGKALLAIERLKKMLAPGGTLLFTFPLGHNKILDQAIIHNKVNLSKCTLFVRSSLNNDWITRPLNQARNIRYNYPFPHANGVIVAQFKKH